jgi:mono/diheme cytochrome c family protein
MGARLAAAALLITASVRGQTVWDGVYTADQASRGEQFYGASCAGCHRGGFIGERFMDRWREDNLGSLYGFIRLYMPAYSPGILPPNQYVDIVAFLLRLNSFPAGKQELTAVSVDKIQVVGKEGPQPVPDGSLIRAIGCLNQTAEQEWIVADATEPVRTMDPDRPKEAELKAAASRAAGEHLYRLADPDFYKPGPHKGHRVEVKGFITRKPGGDRLNLISLDMVASACDKESNIQ